MVPKFTRRALATRLRSAISSGAVAMMGDAPRAMVALADWVVTTLFVIWKIPKVVVMSSWIRAHAANRYLVDERGELFDATEKFSDAMFDRVCCVRGRKRGEKCDGVGFERLDDGRDSLCSVVWVIGRDDIAHDR